MLEKNFDPEADSYKIPALLAKYYYTAAKYGNKTKQVQTKFLDRAYYYIEKAKTQNSVALDVLFWEACILDEKINYYPKYHIQKWLIPIKIKRNILFILNKKPNYADAYLLLAHAYQYASPIFSFGNLIKARKYILIALQYNNYRLKYYFELGKISILEEDYVNAQQQFQIVLDLPEEPGYALENKLEKYLSAEFLKRLKNK